MKKLLLIAGPCAIEDKHMAMFIANHCKKLCEELDIEYMFKGSYKKANRSRLDSFTGIGDEEALKILKEVGDELAVRTITDVHESHEPSHVANYVDALQIKGPDPISLALNAPGYGHTFDQYVFGPNYVGDRDYV